MNFDDQMRRYFGSDDLASVSPAELESGKERLAVDLGLEKDSSRRFALWALMHILGCAPDLDVAFKDAGEQNAARDFMDLFASLNPASE